MTSSVPLAERSDIHKSCKTMETLVNVLNDYCEVSGTLAALDKKLAKALRDAAGLKAMTEIPGNAFNASATIFESLADINSKFSKLADKEYDFVSTEVKKWFKKLAKEEKAHNEKITSADAKIKQAGLAYEKKAKKNPREAQEEHARYVGLLTTLGPEITQEKYNHAAAVTQRHTTTTYHLAGCLSRLADAEWVRTCEGVRRFSPSVGRLGELRALCEGGWIGDLPSDLPDVGGIPQSEPTMDSPRQGERPRSYVQPEGTLRPGQGTVYLQPHSPGQSRAPTPSSDRQSIDYPRPRPLSENFTDSVRTLSAFPSPPNHFPLPPTSPKVPEKTQSHHSIASITQAMSDGARFTESPLPQDTDTDSPQPSRTLDPKPTESLKSIESKRVEPLPPITEQRTSDQPLLEQSSDRSTDKPEEPEVPPPKADPPVPQPASPQPPLPSIPTEPVAKPVPTELADEREMDAKAGASSYKTSDEPKQSPVEQTDTGGSTASIVAQLRNKYSQAPGTASPPPKSVPRLPLSVTEMASRYEPTDPPASPRLRSNPSISHQLSTRRPDHPQHKQGSQSISSMTPTEDNSFRRRKQLAELELKERERDLRAREEEISRQTRELERERARLGNTREQQHVESLQSRPGERRYTQPLQDASPVSTRPSHHSQYSYNSNANPHLIPPSSASQSQLSQPQRSPTTSHFRNSHQRSPSPLPYRSNSPQPFPGLSHAQSNSSLSQSRPSQQQYSQQQQTQHPASCTCETCSLARYHASLSSPTPASPTSYDYNSNERPMVTLRTEKPAKGGWMRRLSMPSVGFSGSLTSGAGDRKEKGISNMGISSKTLFAMEGKRGGGGLNSSKNGMNSLGVGSHGGPYAVGSNNIGGLGTLSGGNASGLSVVTTTSGARDDARYGQEVNRRSYDIPRDFTGNDRSSINLGLRR